MALVDTVTDRLADQVITDGVTLQAVALEDIPPILTVIVIFERSDHVEMVAPTGDFDTVIAEGFRLLANGLKIQVSPLAGEKCDWSTHFVFSRVSAYWFPMGSPAGAEGGGGLLNSG